MSIEEVWNSAGNAPSPAERDAMLARSRDELRRIQRRRVAFVACTALSLTAVTGLVASIGATRPSELASAWPAVVLLLAQWIALAVFVREMLAGGRPVRVDATIRESLERLRQEAENSRRGQVVILTLFAVAAPLIGAMLVELQAVGRMAAHEARSAGAFFALILATSTTVVLVRRYLIVIPRHRHLSTLLEQYRSE